MLYSGGCGLHGVTRRTRRDHARIGIRARVEHAPSYQGTVTSVEVHDRRRRKYRVFSGSGLMLEYLGSRKVQRETQGYSVV